MKSNLSLLFTTFLLCSTSMARTGPADMEFQVQRFSVGGTFSDENVRCLFQDRQGYIWMGVDSEGLCRYDGSHFEMFAHESSDPGSISSNYINDMEEDAYGNIWLATERGLNIFDRGSGHFIKMDHDRNIAVNMLYKDAEGTMWAGTEKGLLKYMPEPVFGTHKVAYQRVSDPLTLHLQGIATTALLADGRNLYWIGTRSGLYRYSYQDRKLEHQVYSEAPFAISDNEINSMVLLGPGHLLIGSDNGVNVLDKQLMRFSRLEFGDCGIFNDGKVGIVDIHLDTHGVAWIGTTTYGVLTGNLTHTPAGISAFSLNIPSSIKGLTSSYITDIYEDQNEQILIATKFGGVFAYDRRSHTFPLFSLPPTEGVADQERSFIISATEDQDGNIWIGTRDRGLIRLNPETGTYTDVPLYQGIDQVRRIETIFCDPQKSIWLGHKKGLNLLDTRTLTSDYFEFPKVLTIDADGSGLLWVGTKNGLFRFDPRRKTTFQHPSRHHDFFESQDLQISRIVCEDDGGCWFGTDSNGLYWYQAETDSLVNFRHDPANLHSISGNVIRSIYRDRKGRLWVGTKSSGLNLYDGAGFTCFTEQHGLPSNTAFSILEDEGGFLWITTNNGLTRYDADRKEFLNFNKSHGLQGNVFEKYAAIKLGDGRLLVAGNNGYNLFDPAAINLTACKPPLVISLIRANAKTVRTDVFSQDTMRLAYSQNILSFDFAALDYRDLHAIQYKYKLTGIDGSWVNAGHKNHVTYTNLPHGEYEFMVQATNADGVWSDETLGIKIFIDVPPWLTWWAKTLYVLLVSCFIYFLYWLASLRAGYLHKLQAKELELGRTNELNQLKLNFFTNISHELRTPLTLIMAPLEKLRKSHHRDHVTRSVTLAYRSARQLLHLTDQLLYFRKVEQGGVGLKVRQYNLLEYIRELAQPFQELAETRKVHLQVSCEDVDHPSWFDPDKLEKIINNLMINAFKFTPVAGHVILSVTRLQKGDPIVPGELSGTGDVAMIIVSDDGEGIEEDRLAHIFDRYYQADGLRTGNGIGLELVKSLVKMHRGVVQVRSRYGEGTQFSVFLPLDIQTYHNAQIEDETIPVSLTSEASLRYLLPETNFTTTKKNDDHSREFRLLIVEDNPELLRFLAESLEDDFRIRGAADGQEALLMTEELPPDIILSDVMMPNSSGLELCRKVKENMATSHIPVILLTAKSMEEHQIHGFESGADAYIIKPFDIEVLKVRLKTILKNRNRLLNKIKDGLIFEPKSISDNKLDVHFLSKIIEIIEQNYVKNDFCVEAFAYDLNLSRSQLFRKMKSLTGQTPSEFLYAFRIKKAIALLEERHLNVAEIAYRTGFSSPNSFSKTFTKHTGVSPSKYASAPRQE